MTNFDLKNIKGNSSCIPSYCFSFSEAAVYVSEAIENEYNNIFQQIGIKELAIYESTGVLPLYEGDLSDQEDDAETGSRADNDYTEHEDNKEPAKLSIGAIIAKGIKKILEVIKGFFEKAYKWFTDAQTSIMSKIGNSINLDKIKDDAKIGKMKIDLGLISGGADKVDAKFKDLTNKLVHIPTDYKKFSIDNCASEICLILENDAKTVNDLKNKIKDFYTLKDPITVTGAEFKKNYKNYLDCCKAKTGDNIKKEYKNAKDLINKLQANKPDSKGDDAKLFTRVFSTTLSILVSLEGIFFDYYKTRFSNCAALLLSAKAKSLGKKEDTVAENNRNKVPEKFKDGYMGESKSILDEAFAWLN